MDAPACACCPRPAVVVVRDAADGDEAPMCPPHADEHLLASDGRIAAVRLAASAGPAEPAP